jgi:hypothetical protein
MAATRIGVTGHRLLAPHPRLVAAVDDALTAIEARRPAPYQLLSGFAEGADELVAQRALERGWEVHALLPLPVDDFTDDMARPDDFRALLARAARVEEPTAALPRPDCYLMQGLALVERSHELLALWNGAAAHGAGGTADIVAAARTRGRTVIWIEAGDVRDGTAPEPVTHLEERG